jgi:4'-phosphopantetheinyl transferase
VNAGGQAALTSGTSAPTWCLTLGPAGALLLRVLPAELQAARDGRVAGALAAAAGRSDLQLRRRPSGRPSLAPPLAELGVSLAHSGDWLLAGYAPSTAVGVDLEADDPQRALEPMGLALDHFSATEARVLAAAPATARRGLFLRMWTLKEAVLKVGGRGVFDGLRAPELPRFEVTLDADVSGHVTHAGRRIGVVARCLRRAHEPDLHLALAVDLGDPV